jgi:catechol 2,3-dioxygenase-like lactoylglutathione lyase family enzyme
MVDLKLEVLNLPVSDVDRAKKFYMDLGWRLDGDFKFSETVRSVQLTPPGSPCSVIIGTGSTTAAPGSAQGMFLVVSDLKDARAALAERGVAVSEPFHRGANGAMEPGMDPQKRSYFSFASFRDPDGNTWLLQEITQRLPGRVEAPTEYESHSDLVSALRRAEAAHGVHEKKLGQRDADWPDWYAKFMESEQSGAEPPP